MPTDLTFATEPSPPNDAYSVFVTLHYADLVRFLRARTASREDAEDAAQESVTRLLRYRETDAPSSWKPLLYRIAINVAHDQMRVAERHHASAHVSLDDQAIPARIRTPEEQTEHEQRLAALGRAIMELPPKCQRVYLLKRVTGMTHAEVASRCGISVKMVDKHLSNALVILRRKVDDSSAGASL